MQSIQCLKCKHYIWKTNCDAFPDGIPQEIFNGEFDHRQPFEGDNGIQFEPIEFSDTQAPLVQES